MSLQILSAQDTAHRVDTGNPLLNISIFVLFIIGTLLSLCVLPAKPHKRAPTFIPEVQHSMARKMASLFLAIISQQLLSSA